MRQPKKTESWQEALKFINRCPICGANYQTDKAQLFSKNEAANLIHIPCAECNSYFVAMIMVVGHGLSSVGMITDLSYDDITRLHKINPISTDEIIEGYETINNQYFLHSLILNG